MGRDLEVSQKANGTVVQFGFAGYLKVDGRSYLEAVRISSSSSWTTQRLLWPSLAVLSSGRVVEDSSC